MSGTIEANVNQSQIAIPWINIVVHVPFPLTNVVINGSRPSTSQGGSWGTGWASHHPHPISVGKSRLAFVIGEFIEFQILSKYLFNREPTDWVTMAIKLICQELPTVHPFCWRVHKPVHNFPSTTLAQQHIYTYMEGTQCLFLLLFSFCPWFRQSVSHGVRTTNIISLILFSDESLTFDPIPVWSMEVVNNLKLLLIWCSSPTRFFKLIVIV